MQFAFVNNAGAPGDIQSLVNRCCELGYDGVELQIAEVAALAGASPEQVRTTFADRKKQIACLGSSIQFTDEKQHDARSAAELRGQIDLAGRLGCHQVRMLAAEPEHRQSLMETISAFADWLLPLGNFAEDRGVQIVIETSLQFRIARPLWSLMERLNHPAVGVCWNVNNSVAAGERPAVTVPTLNSRIRYVRTNTADIHESLIRLMGIGYTGWVTAVAEPGVPGQFFADALTKLRQSTTPQLIKGAKTH